MFEILNEIKENLNFEIIQSNKKDFESLKLNSNVNYVVLSSKKHININNCLVHDNPPIRLEKLIEFINTSCEITKPLI